MMIPAKGWPAFRIVTCEQRPPPAIVPAAPTPRGLNRPWSAVSQLWRRWHDRRDAMRALADIPDDELRNLSEAGQRMRHEARLELEASERKKRVCLHAP
jgi:uncharacterized protein YjiS (DUF1127 family)